MTRKKSTTETPLTLDANTGKPVTPPPSSPINLHDVAAVRRELAKVYRDARAGKIDPQDGTRFAYILMHIAKLHEVEDLDRRIKKLESNQP